MKIAAADVKKLRELTNVGMMDCKKALVESHGDLEKAKLLLKEKGQTEADGKRLQEGGKKNNFRKVLT